MELLLREPAIVPMLNRRAGITSFCSRQGEAGLPTSLHRIGQRLDTGRSCDMRFSWNELAASSLEPLVPSVAAEP